MRSAAAASLVALGCLLAAPLLSPAADRLPRLKFNEVKEVAPGVFFRYSAISPTDPSVFGGCNNIWVVFRDYVVVIDANFPREANDVIAAIRKTTDKPIRYVLDTHHHGDHSYGNAVFGRAGASIVAQANCAHLLRVNGPREFAEAGRGPTGRKDVAASSLRLPDLVFDDKLVLDDGSQRIEFLFLGHAHTAGDAVAYLPHHKLLCTGDACVNGAYNFMGNSDSASWVRVLERMQQLDVRLVCPGHGPPAGKDLVEKQKRYFVELRDQVRKGIQAGRNAREILGDLHMPWYKEWTGVTPAPANVEYVYDELTGRVAPYDLAEDFGIHEGPSPTKETPGWKPPRRIVVPSGLMPAQLMDLKLIAPEVEFIPARGPEEAARVVDDADAVLGFCTAEVLQAGKGLRWVQAGAAPVSPELAREFQGRKIVLTDTRRVYGPQLADQAFALLLALTRGIRQVGTGRDNLIELNGKTMLVIGLGGTGTQVSRRAHAFGMRVLAIDPHETSRPPFVFRLEKPDKLKELLPQADVIVLACPLTQQTRELLGAGQLQTLKRTAYLINVAHPDLVRSPDLAEALRKKQLAGAGLGGAGSTLPADDPLRSMANVVITPPAGPSPEGRERQWRLYRENVRRFVKGEPLLCVVNSTSPERQEPARKP